MKALGAALVAWTLLLASAGLSQGSIVLSGIAAEFDELQGVDDGVAPGSDENPAIVDLWDMSFGEEELVTGGDLEGFGPNKPDERLLPQDVDGLENAGVTLLLGLDGQRRKSHRMPEPASLMIWTVLAAAGFGLRFWQRRGSTEPTPWSDKNRTAIHQIIQRGPSR